MESFEQANEFFQNTFGLSLFKLEEPYNMKPNSRSNTWVGVNSPKHALLRRSGKLTTSYPKSRGMIMNGGRRPVSLNTLFSNLKEGKTLFKELP
jgi:hypothetical protein